MRPVSSEKCSKSALNENTGISVQKSLSLAVVHDFCSDKLQTKVL